MDTSFAGRLAEPYVLALLREGSSHGYALLKALEEAFGEGAIAKARVYQILRKLEDEGLVEAKEGSGNRKEYLLTEAGEARLSDAAAQRPAFFNLLRMLFPDMDVGVANGTARAEELPRDGARPQLHCPGCQDLRIRMERTLPHDELVIHVARTGENQVHAEGCVVGLALRRLASSLLP